MRALLEPELRAGESIEKKLADAARAGAERACRAVAHCWLLRARGRPVQSFAASFWWALTKATPGELEEGAVANLDEARALCERARAPRRSTGQELREARERREAFESAGERAWLADLRSGGAP